VNTSRPNHSGNRNRPSVTHSFTLLEVLLAVFMGAVLTAALSVVFRTSVRFRNHAAVLMSQAQTDHRCLRRLTADLAAIVPPDGHLAKDLIGTTEEESDLVHRDRIEFSAAANSPSDSSFGADVIHIAYELTEAEDPGTATLLLKRSVWDNPLALQDEEPAETVILTHVTSLTIEYYDGTDWATAWDTSLQEGALPSAVRLTIERDESPEPALPLVLIVRLPCQKPEELAQGNTP